MTKTLTEDQVLHIHVEAFKRGIFKGITEKRGLRHEKMELALQILTDDETFEFVYGGAAGGAKSWTGAYWMMMACLSYEGVRGYVTRKRLKDLLGTTLVTFNKVRRELGFSKDVFTFNAQRNIIKFKNGSEIYFLSSSYEPSDPEYERLGSLEFTFGWIEEGGEIPAPAYQVLKTRTGRQNNDKYGLLPKTFITANPTKNWIYRDFYQKRNDLPKGKAFVQAYVYDNPFIESVYIDQLENLAEGAKKQRLLRGNWEFDDDPTALVAYEKIIDMFGLHVEKTGEKFIIVDASRDGGDKNTCWVFDGLQLIEAKHWVKEKTNVSAAKIIKAMIRHGVPPSRVLVDVNGVGGGLADQLPDGVVEFINNGRALDDGNYRSLKDQCGYILAQYINDSRIGMMGVKFSEEEKDLLIEEIEWLKSYDDEKGGKARLLPKDKIKEAIGRSPDFLDTLLMRMYFEMKNKQSLVNDKHNDNNMRNVMNFSPNKSKFVDIAWYVGENNDFALWMYQRESMGDVRIIEYLEGTGSTPADFMFYLQEKVRENKYIINKNYFYFMDIDSMKVDPKADVYRILKKLGLTSSQIMGKVPQGEAKMLIKTYFETYLFRYPYTLDGYYKIKDDPEVESGASKAFLALIQSSTLRERDSENIPVASMRDVKRMLHNGNDKEKRKAEMLLRKIK